MYEASERAALWGIAVVQAVLHCLVRRGELRRRPLFCPRLELIFGNRHVWLLQENSLQIGFRLRKGLAPALAQDVELFQIVLEQISRHFRLFERIADPYSRNVPIQNVPELVHGLRIDLQGLLKELNAQELLRPLSGAEP